MDDSGPDESTKSSVPQLLVVYDDGQTTQVSGQNKLFNEFVANGGFVGDFSGKGTSVSKLHDLDYHVAKLKVLRYDQTFKICGGDARKGNLDLFLILISFQ